MEVLRNLGRKALRQLLQNSILGLAVWLGLVSVAAARPGDDGMSAWDPSVLPAASSLGRASDFPERPLALNYPGPSDAAISVPADPAEAVRWFLAAADRGDREAQFQLGVRYHSGRGVVRDDLEAARWFQLAADQGYAPAQLSLAELYAAGHGVPADLVQALMWASLAQTNYRFEFGAVLALGARYRIATRMTSLQRAEADRMTRDRLTR